MKDFKVTLIADERRQEWYVKCNSGTEAEKLVKNAVGALAEPSVTVDSGNDVPVALELVANKPVQWV